MDDELEPRHLDALIDSLDAFRAARDAYRRTPEYAEDVKRRQADPWNWPSEPSSRDMDSAIYDFREAFVAVLRRCLKSSL